MSGRRATTDVRPGQYALAVGNPGNSTPKGWRWRDLNEVAEMATGHTPSRRKPEYWGGDIPWMSVKDARPNNGKSITETEEMTNQLGIENSAAVLLPTDTVCLSRTGSIGYSVLLGRPMATSQGFVNWICGPELNPRFLQLVFLAENTFLHHISEGVAHTTIYFPEAKAFHVCLPERKVQDRIVSAIETQLGRLDAAVARLHAAKAKLKRYKQAVLKAAFSGTSTTAWRAKAKVTSVEKMLSRIETPPRPSRYNSRSMDVVDGDYALAIGAPDRTGPAGWKWVPLVDIARLESGHTPSKKHPEYWDGDIPWIELRDARDRHGATIHSTNYHTNQLGLDNSAARLLPAGTVCLSRTASVGYVVKMGEPMCTSQDFVNWVCTEGIDPDWLKLLFVAEHDAIWRFGKGTTHTTVYFPEVVSFHILLPPIEEQREIVRLVADALTATEATEATLDAQLLQSTRLRQAVLKRAFEGRLV